MVRIITCAVVVWCGLIRADDPSQNESPLRVALTGKYPPFSFYSADGELAGFDVDVSRAIAQRLDRPLEIIATEWDGILAGLLAGKYDAIIGSMAITAERAKKVSFSRPYYSSGAQIFIHNQQAGVIENIEDLGDKRVGVVLGETYEHYLRTNYPEIRVLTYKSTVDIFQDMHNERLDAFLTDRLVGLYQIRNAGMPFIPAGKLLYTENMGIPVRKQNSALLADINAALLDMRQTGALDQIHKQWFGRGEAKQAHQVGMNANTIAGKLLKGFAITIGVAFISLTLGLLLAIPAGIVLNSKRTIIQRLVRLIIDFIRGTPVLIQLFFVYFGAPQLGVKLSPVASAVITLTINAGAYLAEVIRSGLMAIDPGQKTAGAALGLGKVQTFRWIVWPQAFRIALPPLVNSAVALLKDTALISVIAVAEVIREAQSIISVTYNPMRFYFIVALMFFVFTYPLMKLAGRIERNIKQKGFVT